MLSHEEYVAVKANVFMNDELYNALNTWANKHYRDELSIKELADPALINESYECFESLSNIMRLQLLSLNAANRNRS